jgi:hypothetical protein
MPCPPSTGWLHGPGNAAQAGKLAAREQKIAQAEEAADGILLDARIEAQDIVQQAHRDAESYGYLAETLETIRQAPQPAATGPELRSLSGKSRTLRRLGVAEKRLDLFGDYQDTDPPPVPNWSWTGRNGGPKRNQRPHGSSRFCAASRHVGQPCHRHPFHQQIYPFPRTPIPRAHIWGAFAGGAESYARI